MATITIILLSLPNIKLHTISKTFTIFLDIHFYFTRNVKIQKKVLGNLIIELLSEGELIRFYNHTSGLCCLHNCHPELLPQYNQVLNKAE